MSSFSASSSAYSYSTCGSYSSSSPVTPSSSTAHLPSSPTHIDLTTPLASPAPEGYRKYSLALVESMTKGLQSAQKSASASRAGERPVFRDDLFLDEDPFDLIVQAQAKRERDPRAAAVPPNANPSHGHGYTQSLYVGMDDKTELLDSAGAPMPMLGGHKRRASDDPPIARPQLLKFHPSSSSRRSGSASGSGSASSFSIPRITTLAQTGRQDSFLSGGFSTPGSQWSESSFEAMTSSDYTALYGAPLSGPPLPRPSAQGEGREISLDSPFSAPTRRSPPPAPRSSFDQAYVHAQPKPEHDYFSGLPPHSPSADREMDMDMEMREEAELAALSQASQRMSIDDPTAFSVEEDEMGRVEDVVGSSRTSIDPHRHPFERRSKRPSLLHPRPGGSADMLDTDDEWIEGRTVSEMMVTQAGRSVQRSRMGATRTSIRP